MGLFLVAALALAVPARAATGETTLGGGATWAAWRGGRIDVFGEYGVLSWLSLYGTLQAGFSPRPSSAGEGLAAVGATVLYDAFAWVPALTVSGGVVGGELWEGRVAVEGALRRYVAPHSWVSLGGGAEWRPDFVRGLASLAVAFELDG